jgi:hypothetical protein
MSAGALLAAFLARFTAGETGGRRDVFWQATDSSMSKRVGAAPLGLAKVGATGNRMVTPGELRERELPVCPLFPRAFSDTL